MDPLLVISVACFFALFVAALAIAQHVLARTPGRTDDATPPNPASISHAHPRVQLSPQPPAHQNLHSLTERKQPDWRFLISEARHRTSARTPFFPGIRKPPASITSGPRRADWTYFNHQLGDLSDPYSRPKSTGTDTARP